MPETAPESGRDLRRAEQQNAAAEAPPVDHILQFFAYRHLPPQLQETSKLFADLAGEIVAKCPRNPERTVALRKLLEAKDAAVRASLAR